MKADRVAHDAVAGRSAPTRRADDLAQRLPGQVDQRHRQLVDVAELPVEAVGRDAGLARDLAQAQAGHAAVRPDQAQRRRQQVVARNRGLAAGARVVVGR
jgi:hypothetical protein